ncbi:MAG TPA: FliM/FliN family flagellar motor switch protein [Bryobacteraceae bacterium]|jgi:flagellar motor switch protein FliN
MEKHKLAARLFLEAWTPELMKSVEMFTGTTVTVEAGDNASASRLLTSGDSVLWLKQAFEGGTSGGVWIGTPGTTCVSLTEGSADEADGREALLKELLVQSLAGAAHLLSSGRDPKLSCGTGEESGSPPDVGRLQAIWLLGSDQKRMPLFFGLDPDLLDWLSVEEEPPVAAMETGAHDLPTVIDQLLDLELPVAVVLGRTRLPIRDLIKLTAGSLVELERRAGDLVDIVVHNVAVAKGEVVSIGGNYGVKIREVISRSERLALQKSAAPAALRGPVRPVIH